MKTLYKSDKVFRKLKELEFYCELYVGIDGK